MNTITSCYINLWSKSQNHVILKGSIISGVSKLVELLGNQSASIAGFTIPLIKYSTDTDHPDQLYYTEAGIDLWIAVMQNSSTMPPELLAAYQNVLKLLNRNFDTISELMKITESYVLLGQLQFLNVCQFIFKNSRAMLLSYLHFLHHC